MSWFSDELVEWHDFIRVCAVNREAAFEMLIFLRGGEDD